MEIEVVHVVSYFIIESVAINVIFHYEVRNDIPFGLHNSPRPQLLLATHYKDEHTIKQKLHIS